MADITMPKMGFDMEEGTIVRWIKKVGDTITKGEPIAEIETDKVTIEIEAFASGKLTEIVVQEGQTAPVNAVIAHLDGPEASAPAEGGAPAPATPAAEAEPVPAASAETATAREEKREERVETATASAPSADTGSAQPRQATPAPATNGEVKASPLAKRIAREAGVDLSQIAGSGPGGRIVRDDVHAFVSSGKAAEPAAQPAQAAPAPAQAAPPAPAQPAAPQPAPQPAAEGATVVPLTNMRKTITRRLGQSWSGIPHIYITIDVDMGAALALRKQANEGQPKEQQFSVNDLVVKACATALTSFPNINASYSDEGVVQHGAVNVAIAVALDAGLITPVIKNADQRSLGSLAREAKRLVALARDNKLAAGDLQNGTFTVSNLGMYGILEFTSIINPPQAAILSVGVIQRVPAFVGDSDEVVARNVMHLTIGADHRVTDGAEAARFLTEVKRLLENPMALLVG